MSKFTYFRLFSSIKIWLSNQIYNKTIRNHFFIGFQVIETPRNRAIFNTDYYYIIYTMYSVYMFCLVATRFYGDFVN